MVKHSSVYGIHYEEINNNKVSFVTFYDASFYDASRYTVTRCDLTSHSHLRFRPAESCGLFGTEMADKHPVVFLRNRLLDAFESESRARVDPYLERIDVNLGHVVCEAGGVLHHAYFPVGAVLSLLTVLENGSAIETANIGREGAFGLFASMYSRVSFNRSLVQLEGGLLRIPIQVLQSEFQRSEHIRNLFVSYSETLLAQVQQTVACNALHTTRERICRWLLMMHDRAQGRIFGIHA